MCAASYAAAGRGDGKALPLEVEWHLPCVSCVSTFDLLGRRRWCSSMRHYSNAADLAILYLTCVAVRPVSSHSAVLRSARNHAALDPLQQGTRRGVRLRSEMVTIVLTNVSAAKIYLVATRAVYVMYAYYRSSPLYSGYSGRKRLRR